MKKKLAMIAAALAMIFSLCGCGNYGIFDTTYKFDYAIISLPNGEIDIAKAEAEALKISAEAEAEANRIIAESLTDEIIEKILADAWDGELPDVVGSGDYILPSDIFDKE